MSLIELPDLIQGSDEWLEVRRGMLTASVIGQLITPSTLKPCDNPKSRSIVAELAAERVTGFTEPSYASDDMLRGHDVEPLAIEAYSEHYAPVTPGGFMVRNDLGFNIGYSPDGLVGADGLVECKSRRAKKHLQTILADAVPAENMAQCQAGLFVSGRMWIDYVSYCGGMPLFRKRVEPDERWFHAIVQAATEFERAVEQMVATYHEAVEGLPMTERIVYEEMVI